MYAAVNCNYKDDVHSSELHDVHSSELHDVRSSELHDVHSSELHDVRSSELHDVHSSELQSQRQRSYRWIVLCTSMVSILVISLDSIVHNDGIDIDHIVGMML